MSVQEACNNAAFFQSIVSRLQKLALARDITEEQRVQILGFATNKFIVDGAKAGPQPKAAGGEDEHHGTGGKQRRERRNQEERLNASSTRAKPGPGGK